MQVSELYIYPIKSLGGIAVSSAELTDRGFQYDRRWMLIDEGNNFLTQREYPQMALLQVDLIGDHLVVSHKINKASINISVIPESQEMIIAKVWSYKGKLQLVSTVADKWFSTMLSIPCRLVYMPDSTIRKVSSYYAVNKDITSLSDGYPLLLIGEASLQDLNSRLSAPVPIDRFRPNIVFSGGKPFEEDTMAVFEINGINFYGVKLCARCAITTIDQNSAEKNKEPLKTLASYRKKNFNIYFGQNVIHGGSGKINIGDTIRVIKTKRRKIIV
ncbi:MOSC domain-containing protein [Ferruginibacter lapsinanis]|uniref:MOSC domain-containing protein n=1 Tax=Ferruginibacter lapsinanis TaxID=563172 RepID=UPI001E4B5DC1|nr:MOSC N-terminal beta barrel domain-containing protein [Ferruginibacter lapsinanis]UEG50114.1 MOSC domain-containing protein [Ferruginibacter lapsinanis]